MNIIIYSKNERIIFYNVEYYLNNLSTFLYNQNEYIYVFYQLDTNMKNNIFD